MSFNPTESTRRWRILVIGNSVATMVHDRSSRLEGPYPELLEQLLRDKGLDVEVRNAGREFGLINDGIYRYQELERAWSPDVLIVNFGMAESQPPFIPHGVYNHFMTWDVGLSRPAQAYRRKVAPWLWTQLRKAQRAAVSRMGMHGWRINPRKYVTLLKQVIFLARYDHRLVLVLDINPPGERIAYSLPGAGPRRDKYQELTLQVVAEARVNDPDGVKLIESSKIADELGMDAALPDGYHFSAKAHRRMAEMLAAEIEPWIASLH